MTDPLANFRQQINRLALELEAKDRELAECKKALAWLFENSRPAKFACTDEEWHSGIAEVMKLLGEAAT